MKKSTGKYTHCVLKSNVQCNGQSNVQLKKKLPNKNMDGNEQVYAQLNIARERRGMHYVIKVSNNLKKL